MASVTIPCPSCEAGFAVKESLIGKKVDCPKCKYRFKAELPEDDDDTSKSRKSEKGKKKGGSNTLVIGGVIGALALILLSVAAFFILSGDKPQANANKGGTTTPRPAVSNSNTNTGSETSGSSETKNGTEGQPPTGNGEGSTSGGAGETPKPKPVNTGNLKDVTNLLPGETIAVYKVVMDRVIQTPVFNSIFDKATQEFFRNSLTFDAADIETYHHCIVNPDRTPFGVFRLKKPLDEQLLLNRIENVKGPQSPIKGRHYNTIKANPFLDAIGRAMSAEALRGEFNLPKPEEDAVKPAVRSIAYHVYDSHTLIIADQLDLERFLFDLDEKGDPPMKSILSNDSPTEVPSAEGTPPGVESGPDSGRGATPPPPPTTSGGPPGGRTGPGGMSFKGIEPGVIRTQGRRPPGGVAGPEGGPDGGRGQEGRRPPGGQGPGGTPQTQPRKSFSSNPHYRTIEEEIKYMLNRLEEADPNNPPAVLYAEKLDQRYFNQRYFGALFRATGERIFGLISQVKVVGAAIRVFNKDKLVASAAFEFQHDEDARQATTRLIVPLLEDITPFLSFAFGTQIDIRNNAGGGGGGGGGRGPGSAVGPGGAAGVGGDAEGAGGNRGAGGGRGGSGRRPPGGDGGDAGAPGSFGDGGNPGEQGDNLSFISVNLADRATVLGLEILWNEERYKRLILPQIVSASNQVKGRMAVLSGETTWHSLAAAFPKLSTGKKPFPRGTLEREIRAERFGLAFPPEQRVSFLAELLPYIGRGGLRSTIQEKKFPWYAKENLPAAESWVSEFLVPYYPQQSWRAYHPMAEGKVLGATNFVGISGLGLDSARFNPTNPEYAKKVGITGYDWGSTPAEITDGMSNTIYMLQAPPGISRAWIAGGGATIVGVDDTVANPIQDFVHTAADKRRGTYALMADGSVRWIPESIDPKVFKGMVTRAGGETLGDLDKLTPKVAPPKGTSVELKGSGSAISPPKPNSGAPAKPAETLSIDAEELKKFQGDWKVTTMVMNGNRMTSEQLKMLNITFKVEAEIIRIDVKAGSLALPTSRIIGLDPKSKVLSDEALDGPTKGKKDRTVYEFIGANKINMRSAEEGKPLPARANFPEAGSKDTYVVLEKIDNE